MIFRFDPSSPSLGSFHL